MYPAGFSILPRISIREHTLEKLKIRKGDVVEANILIQHYNPKFFKNPFEFR